MNERNTAVLNTTCGLVEGRMRLAELVDRVLRGEQVTLTRHRHPVVRLVPVLPEENEKNGGNTMSFTPYKPGSNDPFPVKERDLLKEAQKDGVVTDPWTNGKTVKFPNKNVGDKPK